jgi:hypothetical protein
MHRTSQAAVEPVPSPTRIPFSTNWAARFAQTNFALSIGERSEGMGNSWQLLLRLIGNMLARCETEIMQSGLSACMGKEICAFLPPWSLFEK